MLTNNDIVVRRVVFESANELVKPIIEQHGLEEYKQGSVAFFSTPSTMTKVDQHIDQIIRVADWLLDRD